MSPSRWDRIEQIFHDAVDRRDEDRRAFIVESCAGDEELQKEVESLLRESEGTAEFMERPAIRLSAEGVSRDLSPEIALAPRFAILGMIGSGGMGVVYQARDRETGAVLAIKVLHPETACRAELIERSKSELLLARKITHKNVCRVYDLIRIGDVVSISMEHIEGESLRTVLDRPQGISFRQGLNIARQITAGLAEAHAQGVIHRDLKPENILIARDGTVKVMDFGIARALDTGESLTGTLKGTPAYMSPEQAIGKTADARSDIYSLGLVMYEIFCGQRVFTADTPIALAMKQVQETPAPPEQIDPHVPPFISRVILKCIEKNPAKRFQSVAELETALAGRREAAATSKAELPLPAHLAHWQRSDWLLVVLAISSLLLFPSLSQRTSLANRIQIPFEPAVFERIAQESARTLGAPLGQNSQIRVLPLLDGYDYVARYAGGRAALELADNPVPYFLWHVEWNNGTSIDLSDRGALLGFARDFVPGTTTEDISSEEAMSLGATAMRDFLGGDASVLRLEAAGDSMWRGRRVSSFTWTDPGDYHGLRRHFAVRMAGREIASLESSFNAPAGYVRRNIRLQLLGYLVVPLIMLFAGLSQRSLVNRRSRWQIVLTTFASLMMVRLAWLALESFGVPASVRLVASLNSAIAVALIMPFILLTLERAVPRMGPHKLSTIIRVFGRRAASEPCGLAILRGTLVGLVLLGVDIFLVWFATNYLGMWMDSTALNLIHSYHLSWAAVQQALIAIGIPTYFAVNFAWLASTVAAFVRRSWLAILLAALLMAAVFPIFPAVSTIGFIQPYPWKLPLVLLEYLILAWTLSRFDFLTLMVAMSTFIFCSRNYFFFVMLSPTGSPDEKLAFVVWGLFVAAAAGVAFKSPIGSAYRRVIAAF